VQSSPQPFNKTTITITRHKILRGSTPREEKSKAKCNNSTPLIITSTSSLPSQFFAGRGVEQQQANPTSWQAPNGKAANKNLRKAKLFVSKEEMSTHDATF
jgi:hypothetical protein